MHPGIFEKAAKPGGPGEWGWKSPVGSWGKTLVGGLGDSLPESKENVKLEYNF